MKYIKSNWQITDFQMELQTFSYNLQYYEFSHRSSNFCKGDLYNLMLDQIFFEKNPS